MLLILLIVGMISGAITVSSLNIDLLNNLDFIFLTDFSERMQQTNLQIFISSFSALGFFALLVELNTFSYNGSNYNNMFAKTTNTSREIKKTSNQTKI